MHLKEIYKPSNSERYNKNYFEDRNGNDKNRNIQFQNDGDFIKKIKPSGTVCDVGCSTGEFLKAIKWNGDLFGIEINEDAKIKAINNGISFEKNIFTEIDFFDVVIFRGTIQHVDEPFRMMKAAYSSLKKGGVIIFLATPNSDSVLYRRKLNLPFLDPERNFYIPGHNNLKNALQNYGFTILKIEFPYWNTPYRRVFRDIFLFGLNLISSRFYKHAFWGSSMSIAAQK